MVIESGGFGAIAEIAAGNQASGAMEAQVILYGQATSNFDAGLSVSRTDAVGQFDAQLSVVENASGLSPVATIVTPTAINASGLPPYYVYFVGSGTPSSGRLVSKYTWFFNDINTTVSGGSTSEHSFTSSGSYLVTVRVTDSDGFVGFDTVRVVTHSGVALDLPGLETSGSPTGDTAPLSVTFTSSGSGVAGTTIVGYSWSFGNGLYSKRQNPNDIVYQTPGDWVPTCTIVDSRGVKVADSITIGVNN